jgi:hypothetical protein
MENRVGLEKTTPAIEKAITERIPGLREQYSVLLKVDDGDLTEALRNLALDQNDEQSAIRAVEDAEYAALAYAYNFL